MTFASHSILKLRLLCKAAIYNLHSRCRGNTGLNNRRAAAWLRRVQGGPRLATKGPEFSGGVRRGSVSVEMMSCQYHPDQDIHLSAYHNDLDFSLGHESESAFKSTVSGRLGPSTRWGWARKKHRASILTCSDARMVASGHILTAGFLPSTLNPDHHIAQLPHTISGTGTRKVKKVGETTLYQPELSA